MKKLLQINTVVNSGSTGHIAEELGKEVMRNGWESYIAYGRNPRPSASKTIIVGTKFGIYFHVLITRLFDLHGFGSYFATKKLVRQISKINPDIIHLHNIHGYYLNIKVLFNYLKTLDTPIVWTLHDCWSFTGHCSHFVAVKCDKWKTGCLKCPQKNQYPKSFFDNSKKNYADKKELFCGIKNLTIVTPSSWLADEVKDSFLNKYKVEVVNNGINLKIFRPLKIKNPFGNKKIILGVASTWTKRKGLFDFYKLAEILPEDYKIILVGLSKKQIKVLPEKIKGITRTESADDLASLYSAAFVFFNPTYEDTFPTTNLEALACGTPVITYRTGGSPEKIDEGKNGFVVETGNIRLAYECIKKIERIGKEKYTDYILKNQRSDFDSKKTMEKYMRLYENLTGGVVQL